jgi:glutathione S-transferase
MMIPVEWRINSVSDSSTRADLEALPKHLDQIDGWIANGQLGQDSPNAADLQIGSSLALLRTKGDLRPLISGRPCEQLALRHFAEFPGSVPAGTFPAQWLQSSGRPTSLTS